MFQDFAAMQKTPMISTWAIERPQAFDFDGGWLFNYGVGRQLVRVKDQDKLPHDKDHLDPMGNHISF